MRDIAFAAQIPYPEELKQNDTLFNRTGLTGHIKNEKAPNLRNSALAAASDQSATHHLDPEKREKRKRPVNHNLPAFTKCRPQFFSYLH